MDVSRKPSLAGLGARFSAGAAAFLLGVLPPMLASGDGIKEIPGPVPARLIQVIDGDTIAVRAAIWLGQEVETRVRLLSADAPELKGKCERERRLALRAKDFAARWLSGRDIFLTSIRFDKYGGRVAAHVTARTGGGLDQALSQALIEAGLARPYDGAARGSWCDGRQGKNAK